MLVTSCQNALSLSLVGSSRFCATAMVAIKNIDGPIEVREASGDRVEVRATKRPRGGSSFRDVSFEVTETAGGIEICTVFEGQTCQRRRYTSRDPHVRVDYLVLIPKA